METHKVFENISNQTKSKQNKPKEIKFYFRKPRMGKWLASATLFCRCTL